MSCGTPCQTAKTDVSECECNCDGVHHGNQTSLDDDVEADFLRRGYQRLHPSDELGGELQKVVEHLYKLEMSCILPKPECELKGEWEYMNPEEHEDTGSFTVGAEALILGKEHSGGVEDAEGQGWWVVVICPSCQYQTAWHKILKKYPMKKEVKA